VAIEGSRTPRKEISPAEVVYRKKGRNASRGKEAQKKSLFEAGRSPASVAREERQTANKADRGKKKTGRSLLSAVGGGNLCLPKDRTNKGQS